MDIITIVDKRDRTYEFYFKHNMYSLERLINKKLNKDKNLMNEFDENFKHPNNRTNV